MRAGSEATRERAEGFRRLLGSAVAFHKASAVALSYRRYSRYPMVRTVRNPYFHDRSTNQWMQSVPAWQWRWRTQTRGADSIALVAVAA